MYCQSCKYSSFGGFCAVNPFHMRGLWSNACDQYEHDASKEIVCGNCVAFRSSSETCAIYKYCVEASDKGCMDFCSQEENEENGREQRQWVLSNIKVKLNINSGKLILVS